MYIAHTDVEGESQISETGSSRPCARRRTSPVNRDRAKKKLLTKIGSELDKPDGLSILSMADLESRIWPLAAKKVNGIGRRANESLPSMGITTVAELTAADPAGCRSISDHLCRVAGENLSRPR